MFDFIKAAPELGPTLSGSGKDIASINILSLQKFKPKRILLRRIKQSPKCVQ
jgi:hypothetical protein